MLSMLLIPTMSTFQFVIDLHSIRLIVTGHLSYGRITNEFSELKVECIILPEQAGRCMG